MDYIVLYLPTESMFLDMQDFLFRLGYKWASDECQIKYPAELSDDGKMTSCISLYEDVKELYFDDIFWVERNTYTSHFYVPTCHPSEISDAEISFHILGGNIFETERFLKKEMTGQNIHSCMLRNENICCTCG